MEDFRAKRITAFLDLMDGMVKSRIDNMKSSFNKKSEEVDRYFDLLPDFSMVKQTYLHLKANAGIKELKNWVAANLHPGQIDVNIMTKLDRTNYSGSEPLPVEYNDAHAALRGFAKSTLESSVVLSAGMNPRLFSYIEKWDDFYPDESGYIKKRVIIKVSDFRSAMVQGKMLAKKGIWVSEFRIESGLNCGGHAFASQGNLIGPVLEEFKSKRKQLVDGQFEALQSALAAKNKPCPAINPELRITAQGGVGTAEEHSFLLNHYQLDSVGWGTPFMLVPEAVSIDQETLDKLASAREKDLYLSNISPLGVPFNNLRGNTKDEEKFRNVRNQTPGSHCIKQYCTINSEFPGKPVCTASRQYQRDKILDIETTYTEQAAIDKATKEVTEKACICVGLGTSALKANGISTKFEGKGVSVCPGPNMAYFTREASLKEMVGHIYGANDLLERKDRPNVFVKELGIYVDYFNNQLKKLEENDDKAKLNNKKFLRSLKEGIQYYRELFAQNKDSFSNSCHEALQMIETLEEKLTMAEVSYA
ncbi:hypothetical protein DDZ16_05690 [Marinilabilia rubra]|uniref:Uncharacterized protein n=2 Tax=Marinilabilia rubra TaxID=2162893 RepID=A0A2U2BBV9_9BACT|nr:hypothetical protein DDZ16_05690 [Marinilabilia rubra]